jgi:hypothetical protein
VRPRGGAADVHRHGGRGGAIVNLSSRAARIRPANTWITPPPRPPSTPSPWASPRKWRPRASASMPWRRASSRRASTPAAASPDGWRGWRQACRCGGARRTKWPGRCCG